MKAEYDAVERTMLAQECNQRLKAKYEAKYEAMKAKYEAMKRTMEEERFEKQQWIVMASVLTYGSEDLELGLV